MLCGKYLHAAACHLHKSTNQLSVSTTFLGCRQVQPFLCESRLYSTKDGKPASKDIQGYGRLIQEGNDACLWLAGCVCWVPNTSDGSYSG